MTLLDNPQAFNIPLAEQVLDHVITHPELHMQDTVGAYDCKSPGCIAGWTCHFSGTQESESGFGRMDLAAQLLGLVNNDQYFHDSELADTLFGADEEHAIEIVRECIAEAKEVQRHREDEEETADEDEDEEAQEPVTVRELVNA